MYCILLFFSRDSKDWDELGELNFVWYILLVFFNFLVKNIIFWFKEFVVERMRCLIILWFLFILRVFRYVI